ncbi:MAG: oxygen-insensitive NADPH nitroreductase [Natronospirillum sp.]|uniref:oxygen-insensitive NADPH nitroreductase n=1 Tax=Natronospirillum sp. TaxID=2812955 RepID=UPI0025F5E313|nr:oxygen-insensitive NADPH nitroreductase [Natronospirillum sp.]MCH8552607.1 oxygen-insensitive NADPH nitroreductase [Natronospirillum sp.]
MTDTLSTLQNHRSIRKFTDEPVPQEHLEAYIRAGQAAATSSFIQATTVIQVNAQDQREQMAEWAGNQAYIVSAPVFLVFCADMRRHELVCDMHQAEMLSGFTEQFMTATIDVALFAQNVVVAAEADGLGICYIGGLRNNPDKVSTALELPELVYPVFGLCIGHPDQNPEVKPRLPLSVVLKQDRYEDGADADTIRDYDAAVWHYYETRTGGNKSMTWSEQISGMLKKEARPHMLPFLQQRGFLRR